MRIADHAYFFRKADNYYEHAQRSRLCHHSSNVHARLYASLLFDRPRQKWMTAFSKVQTTNLAQMSEASGRTKVKQKMRQIKYCYVVTRAQGRAHEIKVIKLPLSKWQKRANESSFDFMRMLSSYSTQKSFLTPWRESNPQPSDRRRDALTIKLHGLRWWA